MKQGLKQQNLAGSFFDCGWASQTGFSLNNISNPQAQHSIPLENVTNILKNAPILLQQTSTTTSANKENVPKAGTVRAKRGPNPLSRDPVTGMII